MVLPGQFLERPALVDAGDAVLEGLFHRGARRPALLCCPPAGEGGMDAPPVAELAWALARAGHPSLRFQHRGVGASTGAPDAARAVDDALAAWRHLAETAGPAVALAGVGSGCATASRAAAQGPGARGLVLVAPDGPPPLDGVACPVLVVLPERGAAAGRDVAARWLSPDRGRVEVVPGAEARFRTGLPLMGRAVAGWLAGLRR